MNKITILVIIVAVGFISYDFATKAGAQASQLLVTSSDPSSPFKPEQLALLAEIEAIKLDSSFFKDPVFLNLRDWTVELGSEDAGRPNPFAPISGKVVTKPNTNR